MFNIRQSRSGVARGVVITLASLTVACSDSPSGPKTGSLAVTVVGLPAEASNAVTVNGPAGFSRAVSVNDTLVNLTPGTYTVLANRVVLASGVYESALPTQQVEVRASTQPSQITAAYGITTGSLTLNVSGLPQGAPAAINVTGPGGYSRMVTQTVTLASLTPGNYMIANATVSSGGHTYSPVPLAQTVNILATVTPRSVNATYILATGVLEVSVTGLPAQQHASVTVSGPGGYSAVLTGTTTLLGLFPGTYAVVASSVAAGVAYGANPATQNVDVVASLTPVRANVAYVEVDLPTPAQFNLTIEGMYITQAVQTLTASVPLVADRPGLLRVFVKASAPNVAAPAVRLRLYQDADLLDSVILLPAAPGVTTAIIEGTLASTWNYLVPSMRIRPGLRLLADVDPGNTIAESDESDNVFPRDGTPLVAAVEVTAPLNLTIVPILQSPSGVTGNVTSANVDQFLTFAQKVFPIQDYRVTLHAPVTTAWGPLQSNDADQYWFRILGEVNALRIAEGSTNYYVGIVATPYTSGVAGMAFSPGRAALAWDRLPSASPIVAHELGHSFGRMHAPCGGAANPDPAFPYVLGTIGVVGYDIQTGALKSTGTSDLMGYCGFGWISDYTYTGILSYRQTTPYAAIAQRFSPAVAGMPPTESFVQSPGIRKSLVVWGSATSSQLILEPAFSANTRPVLPSRSGPYRIEGRTAQGRVLFSYAFEGERPVDVSDPSLRSFTFAIPLDDSVLQSVARISLTSTAGLRVERRTSAPRSATFDATTESPGTVRFQLDDPAVPLAIVRDRSSQQILAFVRPGRQPVRVRTRAEEFEVQFSNGVQSTTRVVRPVRR